jgi:4-hydroxy-tetrahydrodipicolinate reductase
MNSPAAAAPVCAVLIGASGRMGRAILAVAGEFPALAVIGAIASKDSPALGRDSGAVAGAALNHVPLGSDLAAVLTRAHVVIDFSAGAATRANLAACRAARKALLIGTTGYGAELESDFAAAAADIPLLLAPNTSLGVTLLLELARTAAHALPGFSAGITETHHREKRDAPSGTALALAAAVRAGRAPAHAAASAAEVPISSVREGEVVGEHVVQFAGPGEELLLAHRATDRAIYARGALAAALWLAPRPAGRYAMRDMLYGKTVT